MNLSEFKLLADRANTLSETMTETLTMINRLLDRVIDIEQKLDKETDELHTRITSLESRLDAFMKNGEGHD